MGVPLLLTWLRNNFGQCITYVAPRHTQWGRKRHTNTQQSLSAMSPAAAAAAMETMGPAPLPHGVKPRANIPHAKRTNAVHTYDNLYIDLNSLLYQSVTMVVDKGVRDAEAAGQRAAHLVTALTPSSMGSSAAKASSSATASIGYETETKILAQLVVLLDELILMTNPTSLIYIAVDGVSPKGKMSQQRTRRANTVKKGFHAKIKSLLGWDSNAITSGTLFMQRVTQVLHYYAVSRVEKANGHSGVAVLGPNGSFSEATMDSDTILDIAMDRAEKAAIFRERYPGRVLPPGVTFVINDVRIAGEGEHKIIDAIRSFRDVKAVLEIGSGNRTGSESVGPDASGGSIGGTMHMDGVSIVTPKRSPLLGADASLPHVSLGPSAAHSGATNAEGANIRGETAPPYAVFQYNPNTTHCIVSPDTDVVVCSLSLHEPHMTVFWYNAQDGDDSQFFSLLAFRQMLKGRLGFTGNHDDKEMSLFFEESLHDLIFILLLFGNDFLPKASALTDIAEGQLDKLLEFFVTDFVSRKRHIVDARTGRIDFAAARYIIDFAVNSEFQTQVTTVASTVASAAEHERRKQQQYNQQSGGGGYASANQKSLSELRRPSDAQQSAGYAHQPFNPFAEGNDVIPGTTPKAGQPQLSEEEIASRCYDYWGGLQWAMLYCTGPCPSWSWQYFHTTVPSAEYLSKYCGMRDDLFDSCFVTTVGSTPSRNAAAKKGGDGAAEGGGDGFGGGGSGGGGGEQHYVGRSDMAMDVVMQLVLLMPFGSRELLPVSIIDAYTRELAPQITDKPFEEIDLKFVLDWCERQKAKLAAVDAQRLASFNTDRNPSIIRYMWPAQGIAQRMLEPKAGTRAEAAANAVAAANDSAASEAESGNLLSNPFGAAGGSSLDPFGGGGMCASNIFGGGSAFDPFGLPSPAVGSSTALGGGGGGAPTASGVTDDDLFGGLTSKPAVEQSNGTPKLASCADTPTRGGMPQSPAINPTPHKAQPLAQQQQQHGNEWVRLAGPYHVPYPKSSLLLRVLQNQHQQFEGEDQAAITSPTGGQTAFVKQLGGIAPSFTGLVTFFFDFKEELNVPGMNTVTNVYRCGDAATEKACAPMVSLQSDWSRHRPCLIIGECREALHSAPTLLQHGPEGDGGLVGGSSSASQPHALLSMTMTNTIRNANSATSGYLFRRSFLLPGVVQVPRGHVSRKRQREEGTATAGANGGGGGGNDGSRPNTPAPLSTTTNTSSVAGSSNAAAAPQPLPSVSSALEERKRLLAARLAAKTQQGQ